MYTSIYIYDLNDFVKNKMLYTYTMRCDLTIVR